MTYLISPSQFRAHKECPQKHKYVYGDQLRPRQRQTFFEVGSYFHELAHFYYQLLQSGYEVGSPHTEAAMDSKLREDLGLVDFEFHAVMMQVHIMFRRFLEKQTADIDTGIEVLEVEKELHVDLNDEVGLHGIVDLIYKRKGKHVIRDHKTGEYKASHSQESIALNDQLLTYAAMYWKITDIVPMIEISWINSKVNYKNPPSKDQLFGTYHKTLTKEYLEAFWQYTEQYVYHMQTVPVIRYLNDYKCKSCPFREPCTMSLRGLDTRNIIDANFKKVPRNHDYAKFTEIARSKTPVDNKSEVDPDRTGGFEVNFNFS